MNRKPAGLHHVELYVSDLQKSKDFYSWFLNHLGYSIYQEWEMGFSFITGDTYIVFVQTQEKYQDVNYHRCRTGLNHLAFWADSREAVDHLTGLLKQKGIPLLYKDRHPYAGGPDYYAVYFEDPDRIKLEVVAYNNEELDREQP